jgi:hypothetical protein
MAVPDAAQGQIVQIENGPTFEVWQSSTGALRLDWNRQGVVTATVLGHGHADYGHHVTRRWDAVIRTSAKIVFLLDFWDMPTYDSGMRTVMTTGVLKHRSSAEPSHVVTRSKLVGMGVAVANLATGGLFTIHSARVGFDLVVKKNGLPVNPLATK